MLLKSQDNIDYDIPVICWLFATGWATKGRTWQLCRSYEQLTPNVRVDRWIFFSPFSTMTIRHPTNPLKAVKMTSQLWVQALFKSTPNPELAGPQIGCIKCQFCCTLTESFGCGGVRYLSAIGPEICLKQSYTCKSGQMKGQECCYFSWKKNI